MFNSIGTTRVRLRTVNEAAHWFAVMRNSPPANDRLSRDFLRWLTRSPQHVAEILRLHLLNSSLWRICHAIGTDEGTRRHRCAGSNAARDDDCPGRGDDAVRRRGTAPMKSLQRNEGLDEARGRNASHC